jgi:molybdopterin converting factor subunit 1
VVDDGETKVVDLPPEAVVRHAVLQDQSLPGFDSAAHLVPHLTLVRVRVRLFAALRDLAGRNETTLELPPGATAEDAWAQLVATVPALDTKRASLAAAVNRRYAPFSAPLHDGDEVAFVPPVSGG